MKTEEKKARGIRKPRGYQAGNIAGNLRIARTEYIPGNEPVSDEAYRLWGDCQLFGELSGMKLKCAERKYEVHFQPDKAKVAFYGWKKATFEKNAKGLGMDICERMLWAIENKDGDFFRDLARLCETPQQLFPHISLRAWLIYAHWDLAGVMPPGRKQDHYFTAHQLCDMAFKRGIFAKREHIDERRMHEICDQLGIKLLRSKGWKKPRRTS